MNRFNWKLIWTFFAFLWCVTSSFAADKEGFSREASFPGGNDALASYLQTNVSYPEVAMKNNEIGKVFVSFVVEKDGSIQNVKVEKGVSSSLDEEAMRVVRSMPKWTPAVKEGKEVRAALTLPIVFHLPNKVLDN